MQVWIKEHDGNCSAEVTEQQTGDCDSTPPSQNVHPLAKRVPLGRESGSIEYVAGTGKVTKAVTAG